MTISAVTVALYAIGLLVNPDFRSPFILNLFAHFPALTPLHFIGGAIAIVSGAFQFVPTLRRKHIALHRLLGRCYVVAILCSGSAGFVLAINSVGGLYAQLGFGLMAIVWLITTIKAYLLIRQRQVQAHRQWMIRSYAVTLAGVTLRLYLGISVLLGIKFVEAYPVFAWLCWVPNLLIAELLVRFHYSKKNPSSDDRLAKTP
jgi:uncharacterized membrane protein